MIAKANAFFELFVVLAFAIGWAVMEYAGKRLDRKREEERAAAEAAVAQGEMAKPKDEP